ncbi:MAG: DUF1893 domain-containing protein [Parcubacteria group bacterium]|jgi:hypothetical protein
MKKYNLAYFQKSNWTFVLMKNGKIVYRSKKEGLKPLLFCLKNRSVGNNNYCSLQNAVVYDKIVGRAAACLMIYGKVKSVMTPTISRAAIAKFKKYNIKIEYLKTTGKIMNRLGDDICPMEKLSRNKKPGEFARIMMEK